MAKFRPRPKRKAEAEGDAEAEDAPVNAKAEAAPVDAEIDDHPLLNKSIRVVNEAAGTTLIGRAGQVVKAFEVTEASGAKWTRLSVLEGTAGAKYFFVSSEFVQETQPCQSPQESQSKSSLACRSPAQPTRSSHTQQAGSLV